MQENYKKWIEKFNLNFQFYVNENEEIPIYKKIDLEERVSTLNELQGTFVEVLKTSYVNDEYYYYIQYEDNTLGWCKPVNSLSVFRTKREEIRLKDGILLDNTVNKILGVDLNQFEESKSKILVTDFCIVFDEEIYYGVKLKDELLGFINVGNIYFFKNYKKYFKFINEKVNLYKDSRLKKPILEDFEHNNKEFKLFGNFEGLNTGRVVIDEKRYWVDLRDTNISAEPKEDQQLNDTIINALFYQLNDKLDKQQVFASKKISKLETEINKLKMNEKSAENQIKEIRKLLKNQTIS